MAETTPNRLTVRELAEKADPVDVHVGREVKNRRIAAGLTQTQVGEVLGVAFQQVQKYEAGANRVAPSRLWMLARLFRCAVADFFPPPDADMAAEGARRDAAVLNHLGSLPGKRLMHAFSRIGNPVVRIALADLAEACAADDPGEIKSVAKVFAAGAGAANGASAPHPRDAGAEVLDPRGRP